MATVQTGAPPHGKPLRLWPGVAAVALQWIVRFVVPEFAPDAVPFAVIGSLVGGLAVILWWLFLSRAPWSERLGAVALMVAAMFVTSRLVHESIATGAQGMLFAILAAPVLSLAFVLWAVTTRHLPAGPRRAALVATICLACAVWTLVRTGGFSGNFQNDLQWRWAKTPEERLLATSGVQSPLPLQPPPGPGVPAIPAEPPVSVARSKVAAPPQVTTTAKTAPAPTAIKHPAKPRSALIPDETTAEWGGFRGPDRNGSIPGVRIATDWSASPPVQLWRRPIGPGWSSFAVRGDLLYTQEQRGPDEVVACYRLSTGAPVWAHRDTARFWESNAGAGPRSTPTLGNGRVYTFGATGLVNALDAASGQVAWSRNAASDTDTKVPDWGFASSPLLFEDLVIVAVSGQLVAYDIATGAPRWFGPRGGISYSSPHRFDSGGVAQVLLLSKAGVTSLAPADGKLLWEHPWPGHPIVQPALTPDGDVLISVSDSSGTRRLALAREAGGWRVQERWTSIGLKPYFNDFVVHHGHAFGFDGSILACIDLADGRRKWKGGRFGNGQLVLLPDQDLLLVLSEEGELALVSATPDRFTELTRSHAIDGKTWNHPVLVGDVLLARNGEEMAAFRLSPASR